MKLVELVEDISLLRERHYNATVVGLTKVHADLMILRVRPDSPPLKFEAGQYAVLGLGYWEPRVTQTQAEVIPSNRQQKLVKRAYSISCRILDDQGRLLLANDGFELEFYIVLVRQADHPPALTPRLFQLELGDRLFLGPRAFGRYTLPILSANDQVLFAATGTGEAPHNAMVTELLGRGHRGPVVCMTCVRYRKDLAYIEQHRLLEQTFKNYRYIPLTTREPENSDNTRPDYVGKQYLQDFLVSEDFSVQTGCELSARNTHVLLCGSPDMIGISDRNANTNAREVPGMVPLLEQHGFRVHKPGRQGNIYYEKYW